MHHETKREEVSAKSHFFYKQIFTYIGIGKHLLIEKMAFLPILTLSLLHIKDLLKMLSVIFLSMLVTPLSTLNVMKQLVCCNN